MSLIRISEWITITTNQSFVFPPVLSFHMVKKKSSNPFHTMVTIRAHNQDAPLRITKRIKLQAASSSLKRGRKVKILEKPVSIIFQNYPNSQIPLSLSHISKQNHSFQLSIKYHPQAISSRPSLIISLLISPSSTTM